MNAKPILETHENAEVVSFVAGQDTPNCYSLPFGGGDKLVLRLTPTQLLLGIVAILRTKTDETERRKYARRLAPVLSMVKFTHDIDVGGDERPEFDIPLARSDFGLTVGTTNTVIRVRASSFITLAIKSLLERIATDEEHNRQTILDASEIGMEECEVLAVARNRSHTETDENKLAAVA